MEICVDSIESARNALEGGAMRLEVCAALSEGGLTPSPGLVHVIRRISRTPIYAMIRIRQGHFVYTADEIDAMLYDVKVLKDLRVDGFVFGALTEQNNIDTSTCEKMLKITHPLPMTFHRAFDKAANPFEALETIIKLGFERILTSGQQTSAEDGLELIEKLVSKAGDRIVVMPGAGITSKNICKIKLKSGAQEFHASAKERKVGCNSKSVKIGADADDDRVMVASVKFVNEMVNALARTQ